MAPFRPFHPVTDYSKGGKPKRSGTPHIGSDYTGSGCLVPLAASDELQDLIDEGVDIIVDLTPLGDIRSIIVDGGELIDVSKETLDIFRNEAIRSYETDIAGRTAGIQRFVDNPNPSGPLSAGDWRRSGFGF